MNFISNLVESLFFRSDSMRYWSASLYGLESIKGKAKNLSDPTKPEISFEILVPKETGKIKKEKLKTLPVVLYFQSAQFNMSYSMQQVAFLALESVPVILFDYQGVGETEGEARLDNLDKDAGAVWECVKNSDLIKGRKLVLFGQGVVVLESIYASQKGLIQERHGFILGDLLARTLKETDIQPAQAITLVTCPLVVVNPGKDNFVRKGQRKLFEFSLPKQAEIWNVPGKNYLCVFADNNSPVREKLLDFIKNVD